MKTISVKKRLKGMNMATMENTSATNVTSQHAREVQKVDRAEPRLYDSSLSRKWKNCFSQASYSITSVTCVTSVTSMPSVTNATSMTNVTSLEARQVQKANTVSVKKRLTKMNTAMMMNTLATRVFFERG